MDTHTPLIDPSPENNTHKRGSLGSVIAIILIVILLVIGAFYVWGQRISERRALERAQPVPAVEDASQQSF